MDIKIQVSSGDKDCFFWHRWILMEDTGFTKYYECKDCHSRKATQPEGGYQPINFEWVYNKKEEL